MNNLLIITSFLLIIFLPHLFFLLYFLFGLSFKEKAFYKSATTASCVTTLSSINRVPVSICIPVLNGESDIIRRLDNIIEYVRLRSFEIIVYNDGSRDATKELVQTYTKLHPDVDIKLINIRLILF